tara:strand:+ start:399 stop:554 length:156 start_codon:yes stop_codon:yes gene_type:complete
MNRQFILDIKGVVIYEDEWDSTRIIIQRDGSEDDLEFNKDDIVEIIEEGEE